MTSVLVTPDGKTMEAEAAHGKEIIVQIAIANFINIILIDVFLYFP